MFVKLILRGLRKLSILHRINLVLAYPPNKKFKIPIINSTGYDHFFEKEEWFSTFFVRLLKNFNHENVHFLDIGANIGQTLLKVKSINCKIRYSGFEPNPVCISYLHKLLHINDLKEVQLFPSALSDHVGMIRLNYKDSFTDTTATILDGFRRKTTGSIWVPVFMASNLSYLLEQKANIIKIDVEGSELEVIKGMQLILENDRPLIICEILPVYSKENTFRYSRQCELEKILSELHYGKANIDTTGSLRPIEGIGIHSDIERVNYLFFPEELREKILKC